MVIFNQGSKGIRQKLTNKKTLLQKFWDQCNKQPNVPSLPDFHHHWEEESIYCPLSYPLKFLSFEIQLTCNFYQEPPHKFLVKKEALYSLYEKGKNSKNLSQKFLNFFPFFVGTIKSFLTKFYQLFSFLNKRHAEGEGYITFGVPLHPSTVYTS